MPKTKEQYEAIKLQRKQEILNGALYLFALNGYHATSSDSITKYVGCSHGLLYHYFPTKELLFDELFEGVIKTKHREIIKNIDFSEDPKFLVLDILDAYLNALKNPDIQYACVIYLVLNLHLQDRYIPSSNKLSETKELLELVQKAIERGKATGVFVSDNLDESKISIMALLKGLAYTRIHSDIKKFKCPSSNLIARLILK